MSLNSSTGEGAELLQKLEEDELQFKGNFLSDRGQKSSLISLNSHILIPLEEDKREVTTESGLKNLKMETIAVIDLGEVKIAEHLEKDTNRSRNSLHGSLVSAPAEEENIQVLDVLDNSDVEVKSAHRSYAVDPDLQVQVEPALEEVEETRNLLFKATERHVNSETEQENSNHSRNQTVQGNKVKSKSRRKDRSGRTANDGDETPVNLKLGFMAEEKEEVDFEEKIDERTEANMDEKNRGKGVKQKNYQNILMEKRKAKESKPISESRRAVENKQVVTRILRQHSQKLPVGNVPRPEQKQKKNPKFVENDI